MDVCFSSGSHAEEEEDRREKIYSCCAVRCGPLSRALPCPIFSQIFSVFGNKDSAFFIKIADFALMGPAGLLAAVAQLYAATTMV
jgi:hypothetical protein